MYRARNSVGSNGAAFYRPLYGVNLSGAEFGGTKLPGTYVTDYTYPNDNELAYYQAKGLTLMRLPMKWERYQHTLGATLDSSEVSRLTTFLAQVAARGMKCVPMISNFFRYQFSPGTTCTISNATPGVVTMTNTAAAGDEVFFGTTGTLPAPLSAGTIYYVIATGLTTAHYEIATTSGGAAINTTTAGSGTHTANFVCTIGSANVTNANYYDLWTKMAKLLRGNPAVWGYDIMGEPEVTAGLWPAVCQGCVNAIRAVDMLTPIIVESVSFSSSRFWISGALESAQYFNIYDPADNLIYSCHSYSDNDGSGGYAQSYATQGATAQSGVIYLQPWLDWIHQHGYRGYVGEYGVPNNDSNWLPLLDNLMQAMVHANVSGTCWGAGPYWGGAGAYILNIEPSAVPSGGTDAVQMAILQKYPSYPIYGK